MLEQLDKPYFAPESDDMAGVVRYAADHLALRMARRELPLSARSVIDLRSGKPAHHNWLSKSALRLDGSLFGLGSSNEAVNLVDVIGAASCEVAGSSVISPVGSFAYARDVSGPHWDLIQDVDVWCYLPAEAITGSFHQLHKRLQRAVHAELVAVGIRCRLGPRNDYVWIIDCEGRERLLELKIAAIGWLAEGVRRSVRGNSTLTTRRRRAHSLRPRVEWAAYSAFENHYCYGGAENQFDSVVGGMSIPDVQLAALRSYQENAATAWRRFGPAHIIESLATDEKLAVHRAKLLKKFLLFALLLRDERAHRRVISELSWWLRVSDLSLTRHQRTAIVDATIRDLRSLTEVNVGKLDSWISTSKGYCGSGWPFEDLGLRVDA